MSVIQDLIFDRNQNDVNRVEELTHKILADGINSLTPAEVSEYMGGMKGSYNTTDLNRVAEAEKYIADRFHEYGYLTPGYADITRRWNPLGIPKVSDLTPYLSNLTVLKTTIPVVDGNVPPDFQKMTYEEANDIEKLLFDLDAMLTSMSKVFVRCNQANVSCGSVWYFPEEV